MKTTNITIPYDSEKLSALRQYADKKGVTVEAELIAAMDKLYNRYVPAAVQNYLNERKPLPPSRPPRQRPSAVSEP